MSRTYRKNQSVVTRQIAGETMLIPVFGNLVDMQSIFALDPVSIVIWEALDEKQDINDLVRIIAEKFDVTEDIAEADAKEFLDELSKAGLLESD